MEHDARSGKGPVAEPQRTPDIDDEDLERAADILQEMLNSSQPVEVVSARLREIHELLPAFIKLNVQNALAEGRPDISGALSEVLERTALHPPGGHGGSPPWAHAIPEIHANGLRVSDRRVALLRDPHSGAMSRQAVAAEALRRIGCPIDEFSDASDITFTDYEIVLAHNPHAVPACMKRSAEFAAAGVPLVVDLDCDFESMPLSDKRYATHGLGTLERARAFSAMTLLADCVTVPNEAMMNLIQIGRASCRERV